MEEQNNNETVVAQNLFDQMTSTIGKLMVQNMELDLRLKMKEEEIAQLKLERDIAAHQEELKKGLDHE